MALQPRTFYRADISWPECASSGTLQRWHWRLRPCCCCTLLLHPTLLSNLLMPVHDSACACAGQHGLTG